MPSEDLRVARQTRSTVDAERLAHAPNQEQQSGATRFPDVVHRIDQLVALCVREDEPMLVEHLDESR
jgi:hypothetical protein